MPTDVETLKEDPHYKGFRNFCETKFPKPQDFWSGANTKLAQEIQSNYFEKLQSEDAYFKNWFFKKKKNYALENGMQGVQICGLQDLPFYSAVKLSSKQQHAEFQGQATYIKTAISEAKGTPPFCSSFAVNTLIFGARLIEEVPEDGQRFDVSPDEELFCGWTRNVLVMCEAAQKLMAGEENGESSAHGDITLYRYSNPQNFLGKGGSVKYAEIQLKIDSEVVRRMIQYAKPIFNQAYGLVQDSEKYGGNTQYCFTGTPFGDMGSLFYSPFGLIVKNADIATRLRSSTLKMHKAIQSNDVVSKSFRWLATKLNDWIYESEYDLLKSKFEEMLLESSDGQQKKKNVTATEKQSMKEAKPSGGIWGFVKSCFWKILKFLTWAFQKLSQIFMKAMGWILRNILHNIPTMLACIFCAALLFVLCSIPLSMMGVISVSNLIDLVASSITPGMIFGASFATQVVGPAFSAVGKNVSPYFQQGVTKIAELATKNGVSDAVNVGSFESLLSWPAELMNIGTKEALLDNVRSLLNWIGGIFAGVFGWGKQLVISVGNLVWTTFQANPYVCIGAAIIIFLVLGLIQITHEDRSNLHLKSLEVRQKNAIIEAFRHLNLNNSERDTKSPGTRDAYRVLARYLGPKAVCLSGLKTEKYQKQKNNRDKKTNQSTSNDNEATQLFDYLDNTVVAGNRVLWRTIGKEVDLESCSSAQELADRIRQNGPIWFWEYSEHFSVPLADKNRMLKTIKDRTGHTKSIDLGLARQIIEDLFSPREIPDCFFEKDGDNKTRGYATLMVELKNFVKKNNINVKTTKTRRN